MPHTRLPPQAGIWPPSGAHMRVSGDTRLQVVVQRAYVIVGGLKGGHELRRGNGGPARWMPHGPAWDLAREVAWGSTC